MGQLFLNSRLTHCSRKLATLMSSPAKCEFPVNMQINEDSFMATLGDKLCRAELNSSWQAKRNSEPVLYMNTGTSFSVLVG